MTSTRRHAVSNAQLLALSAERRNDVTILDVFARSTPEARA